MKTKLLYVATALKGGESRHIQDLVNTLKSTFDITIISTTQQNTTDATPIFTLTPIGLYRLFHFLRQHKFKLIHCHGYKALTAIRIVSFIYTKCPTIIGTIHGFSLDYFPNKLKRWFRLKLEQYLHKTQHWTIFVSQSDQNRAIQHQCSSKTTSSVITNGVSKTKTKHPSIGALLRSCDTLTKDTFLCLFCASLEHVKNPMLLLESLHYLKQENKLGSIVTCILGDGPLHTKLEQKINNYKLEKNVFLCGQQENVIEWMQAAQLLVHPSEHEGLPYTLLEAMSVNCPIIATKVHGCQDLIENDKTGILVPKGNCKALANAIYNMYQQPEKRRLYAKNAKNAQEHSYTLEKMSAETQKIYERFIY